MITDLDKAYAAGFFDGEGSVMLHRRTREPKGFVRVKIGQNAIEPLLWLKERWGGHVWADNEAPRKHVYHIWAVEYKKARVFLSDIRPFLKVKTYPESFFII